MFALDHVNWQRAKLVMLEHEMVSETFITLTSDTSTSIVEVKIKFGLVCKQHMTEMLSLPVDVVKGKH